jgi:FkbM family methyltransferase
MIGKYIKLKKVLIRFLFTFLSEFKKTLNIRFENIEVKYYTRDGISKKWFYPRYYRGKIHEPKVATIIYDYLKSDSVFFDIGSNLGYFTVFANKLIEMGSIHSFEIDPILIKNILKSLKLNTINCNIYINNAAIADESGRTLSFSPHQLNNPSTNKIIFNNNNELIQLKIPTLSIDDYVKKANIHPDFIKLDIEGAECFAIQGMKFTLSTIHPIILIEIHPKQIKEYGYNVNFIFNYILQYNYRINLIKEYRKGEEISFESYDENLLSAITDKPILALCLPNS